MALYTPKRVVLNWYQYEANLSIELMVSFVTTVEKHAVASIQAYKKSRSVAGHGGLDHESWDLDSIFGEYFPSLQRRSAFLTLWSFLEHQLDQLCLLYQSERGFALSFTDLSGQGIDRSTSYLEKVTGLKGLKASQEWDVLKTLQRIRNVITHGDGRVRDHSGKPKTGILADMKRIGFLVDEENEITVRAGFLLEVVRACNDYFTLIEMAIYSASGVLVPHYKRKKI